MISLENVSFQYKKSDRPAIKECSLTINDGDFVGIIGTSGAGKTTLALMMNGVIPHKLTGDFYGKVTINGMDTVDNQPEAFCRTVAEVFQDIDSQMVASVVEDEILFGLENFGVPHDEISARVDKVLADLGIADLRDRQISSLSGGQKQKVAIASVLALEPQVMVLDEPTGELDPESSREIYGLLRKLNTEKGITIVVIEQKIMLLCEFCRRLLVMQDGKLCYDDEPRKVVADVEGLKKVGVNLPRVSELAGLLAADGLYHGPVPMDVEEAEKMVREVTGR